MKKLKIDLTIIAIGFLVYSMLDAVGIFAHTRAIKNLTSRIEHEERQLLAMWDIMTNNVRITNGAFNDIGNELQILHIKSRMHVNTLHPEIADALSSNMDQRLWCTDTNAVTGTFGGKKFLNGILMEVEE